MTTVKIERAFIHLRSQIQQCVLIVYKIMHISPVDIVFWYSYKAKLILSGFHKMKLPGNTKYWEIPIDFSKIFNLAVL
jgi:hypothetical protein